MADKYPQKEEAVPHPSVDTTSRFAVDALLRAMGFRIHSRPKGGEAVWEVGNTGVLLTQTEAVKRIPPDDLLLANKAGNRYMRGKCK